MKPRTPEEVLQFVKEMVRTPGGYRYGNHFIQRMEERGATARDVRRALLSATGAQQRENGSWRILGGTDSDDEDLVVAVRVDDGLELVTLFDSNE